MTRVRRCDCSRDSASRLRADRGQHRADPVRGVGGNEERGRGLHRGPATSCGLRLLDGVYNIGLCVLVFQSKSRWDDRLVFATRCHVEQVVIKVATCGCCSAGLGGLRRTFTYVGWGGVIIGAHGMAGACMSFLRI